MSKSTSETVADLLLSACGTASACYAIPIIWGWYIVPLGAPAITWRTYFGLMCLKGIALYSFAEQKTEDDAGLRWLLAVWFMFGFAWAFKP